jgi:hypothetical protein
MFLSLFLFDFRHKSNEFVDPQVCLIITPLGNPLEVFTLPDVKKLVIKC